MAMTSPPDQLTINSLLKEEVNSLGWEQDDSFQLRIMELNLELDEEVAMNALIVTRLTWTVCLLFSCVVIRMSLTWFGLETPSPDAWWDKPVAFVAQMMFSLLERLNALTRSLWENLSANLAPLRAEVGKAASDMIRGR